MSELRDADARLDGKECPAMKLRYYALKESLRFFNAAGISPTFLREDPVHWGTDADFQHSLRFVSQFEIVNDAAKEECSL